MGFPGGSVDKNPPVNAGDTGSRVWEDFTCLRVLLPGKSHRWRSLVGCSPWGCEDSDMTERLHFHFSLSCTGEGNGNPLQCSCLENPRDGGAWWAAIYGVAQSRTRLKWLSSSSSSSRETGPMCHNYWIHALEPASRSYWSLARLESVLRSKRSHRKEKPVLQRSSPCSPQLEKDCTATNSQCSQNKSKIKKKKKREITSVGDDVEKREPLWIVDGNVNWCGIMENSMEVSQKIKHRPLI